MTLLIAVPVGIAIIKLLMSMGLEIVVMIDRQGAIGSCQNFAGP